MPTKDEIDRKYIDWANALEANYFNIIDEGLPTQYRVLKEGKSIDDFNQEHGKIWRSHQAELISEGFMEVPSPPEPVRDLAAEIDDLKTRVELLEARRM